VRPKDGAPGMVAHNSPSSAGAVRTIRAWSPEVSGTAMLAAYDDARLAAYLPMKRLKAVKW
jgi:hypothetical protein